VAWEVAAELDLRNLLLKATWMILLLGSALALLVALLRGGRFSRLSGVTLRYGWIAPLAFALQVAVIYFPLSQPKGLWGWHALLLVSSYVLLILVVSLNWRLPGLPLVGLGLGLNLLVMVANGGFMPVTYEALQRAGMAHLALSDAPGSRIMATKDIVLPLESTRLWVLSDVFVLPPPLPVRSIFSLGDLCLVGGMFVLFQRLMCPRSHHGRTNEAQGRSGEFLASPPLT
jgi:hypothetical protein